MKDVRIYSTVAGEIPLLVQKNIPKCFVEYGQYLELKAELDELKEFVKKYDDVIYKEAHFSQFYDN